MKLFFHSTFSVFVKLAVAVVMVAGMSLGTAHAAYTKIDDFEGYSSGSIIGGQGNWHSVGTAGNSQAVTDPANGANKCLRVNAAWSGCYNALASAIPASSAATIFFRGNFPGQYAGNAIAGLSKNNPPSGMVSGDGDLTVGLEYNGYASPYVGAYNGSSLTQLFNSNATWFKYWIVVNTTANTYAIYTNTAGPAVASGYAFRNGGTGTPLPSFILGGEGSNGGGNNYVDDIYIDYSGDSRTTDPTTPAQPPAPTGLTISGCNSQAVLSWSPATGATGYNMKRSTTSSNETQYATTASTVYTDSVVTVGTTYYYVVSATNALGASANSAEVSTTILASTAPSVTQQPTNLTVSAGSTASFTAAASGASTVQWQVSLDGGVTWSNISGATSTTYGFTAATADNGTEYRAQCSSPCGVVYSAPALLSVGTAGIYTDFTIQLGAPQVITNAIPPVPVYPWFPNGHISFFPDGNTFQMCWAGWMSFRSLGNTVAAQSLNPTNPVLSAGGSGTFDNGGAWLMSIFRQTTNSLIGFEHAEDHQWTGYENPDGIAWKSIVLCTSTDDGQTWTKQGQILTGSTPKPAAPAWGGNGDHCVVYDGVNSRWVCFYSDGWIKMTISTNAIPSPGTWWKYYNGSFTEPGLGGNDSPVPVIAQHLGANPSVHYNTYLHRWVMVWWSWDQNNIWLSTSPDLLNWTSATNVVYAPSPTACTMPTIIGTTDVLASQQAQLYYAYWTNSAYWASQFMGRSISFQMQDSVGDGIPDWWRAQYFSNVSTNSTITNNLSCATCDPDGDRMNNLQEYLVGTDPTNNTSVFRILSVIRQANDIKVAWQAGGGRATSLQAVNGAYNTNFVDISGPILIPGNGDVTINFVDAGGATNGSSRFYRVRLVP